MLRPCLVNYFTDEVHVLSFVQILISRLPRPGESVSSITLSCIDVNVMGTFCHVFSSRNDCS